MFCMFCYHYLVVKNLSALLRRITSKHHGDFYCLNCLHSFATKNKLESQKKVWQKKIFCGLVLPTQKIIISKFNQYIKSDKMPHMLTLNL